FVATGFSIVTTLVRTRVIASELVERYGMTRHCRAIRATDVPVLDLEREGSDARRIVLDECKRAVAEDGAGAIVLGCAGMADLTAEVQQALGVPVIDGVAAAVKFVEALVGMGLGTSKIGDLAWPLPKAYTGALAHMAPTASSPSSPPTSPTPTPRGRSTPRRSVSRSASSRRGGRR